MSLFYYSHPNTAVFVYLLEFFFSLVACFGTLFYRYQMNFYLKDIKCHNI